MSPTCRRPPSTPSTQALPIRPQTTGSTVAAPGSPVKDVKAPASKRFTVVIDPGHGGIDGGADGLHGTVEKSITLAFAHDLRNKLSKQAITTSS